MDGIASVAGGLLVPESAWRSLIDRELAWQAAWAKARTCERLPTAAPAAKGP